MAKVGAILLGRDNNNKRQMTQRESGNSVFGEDLYLHFANSLQYQTTNISNGGTKISFSIYACINECIIYSGKILCSRRIFIMNK